MATFVKDLRTSSFVLALACLLATVTTQPALGQTFTVLHDFTGAGDGGNPYAGLTVDSDGNLYGTTSIGGVGYGIVFKMAHKESGWILTPLYTFRSGTDGAFPFGAVVLGPEGAVYGTTEYGGGGPCRSSDGFLGCGTVFKLNPPSTFCHTASCPWTETVLYRFGFSPGDGTDPRSKLTFDGAGNLYGTTYEGGAGAGIVYEITRSDGGWTETIVHTFKGSDGSSPNSEVIFDAAGNLYGTTTSGGNDCTGTGCGLVYELSRSGLGWTETVLYKFTGGDDGGNPYGGLIFGPADTLYGTTVYGGSNNNSAGTVFKLAPSRGGWELTTLYSLSGRLGSTASLVRDSSGNLYGTTIGDGSYQVGSVFKLVNSGGIWTFSDLHSFRSSDGGYLTGSVVFDAVGNLYGTTWDGGKFVCLAGGGGCGIVWEIAP
jgi:uncharacterized repeat protein (TIGR03803 family)